jgi:hypothetical protein
LPAWRIEVVEAIEDPSGKSTLSVKRVRRRKPARKRARRRVRIGAPDPSLTATSGVAAVAEFVEKLDVVGTFDRGIGAIKQRARGASAGELLVGLAQSQLLGGDALVAEAANAAVVTRAYRLLPADRRAKLERSITIDMDSTDVEVYGSRKEGVAYNYAGQRAGRPHLATWAEAGLSVAADLLAGNDDVRPRAAGMLSRALTAIPGEVSAALAQAGSVPRVRTDAGYFTGDLARAAVEQGCDFAIAAKRNIAMWRAYASIDPDAWVDAVAMPGAQVAAVDYAPAGWPEDAYTIVRRVRVDAEAISADPRSRRRRTIDPSQLALAIDGTATHAYAVSFIVTNIPTYDEAEKGETVRDVEAWFRRRTDIEDRIREAKLGAALRKLPSGSAAVNTVWMWAALLAGNLSVLLQALTGIDEHGRAHAARLRHDLLCVPARLVHHGRTPTLRLPPGDQLLPIVLTRIRELDVAA